MVKCGVLFEVRTETLSITWTKGLMFRLLNRDVYKETCFLKLTTYANVFYYADIVNLQFLSLM
jgi:hypothetical protein